MKLILRKAFTLMEVNIAIFIMSVGVLSMVSLYSLGYREQTQGKDDVQAAAVAETYIAPLVAMLSNPKLGWTEFDRIKSSPSDGWAGYREQSSTFGGGIVAPRVSRSASSIAKTAFDTIRNACGKGDYNFNCPTADSDFPVALVVTRVDHSPVVSISFRSARRLGTLMNQPLYYTEVHFQGDPDK